MAKTVFISYTHPDEDLKDDLLAHLAPLRREGLIGVWHDRMLPPGGHFDDQIGEQLQAADLILLLVSAKFLASDYCTETEMVKAFERARRGEAQVVAVILRSCQWKHIPIEGGGKLGDFLALPQDGQPITTFQDRDVAWNQVVGALRALLVGQPVPTAQPPIAGSVGSPKHIDPMDVADRLIWKGEWTVKHRTMFGGMIKAKVGAGPRVFGRISPAIRGKLKRAQAMDLMGTVGLHGMYTVGFGDAGVTERGAIRYGLVNNNPADRSAAGGVEWIADRDELRFFVLLNGNLLHREQVIAWWADFLIKAGKFFGAEDAGAPWSVELGCTGVDQLALLRSGFGSGPSGLIPEIQYRSELAGFERVQIEQILEEAEADFADGFGMHSAPIKETLDLVYGSIR